MSVKWNDITVSHPIDGETVWVESPRGTLHSFPATWHEASHTFDGSAIGRLSDIPPSYITRWRPL